VEAGVLIWAIQEIIARPEEGDKIATAANRLRQLAEAAGLQCEYAPGKAAVGIGFRHHHVGLLWHPTLSVVRKSFLTYPITGGNGLCGLTFDVDGALVMHASYHASPRLPSLRNIGHGDLINALPIHRAVIVGSDSNTVSADRVPQGSAGLDYYHPDPYRRPTQHWSPEMVNFCSWSYDHFGNRQWWADRQPGETLLAGGLHLAAAVVGAPVVPTTGHYISDRHPPRVFDGHRITAPILRAAIGVEVIVDDLNKAASDHLSERFRYHSEAIDA
jgi:hypothetical protein